MDFDMIDIAFVNYYQDGSKSYIEYCLMGCLLSNIDDRRSYYLLVRNSFEINKILFDNIMN